MASGLVEVYDPANRSQPLARLGPNEVFGWYSTLTGAPTSDTAIAAQDSSLWVIPKESLDALRRGSTAYAQVVHRRLRSPETLDYLVQRQGMDPQAAQQWLDQAAQSLMRTGAFPHAKPVKRLLDSFWARMGDLRHLPLFQGLPAGELDLIADRLIHKVHAKGETLFLQGQPASRLFIIERGRVSLIDPEHRYREPEPRLAERLRGFLEGGEASDYLTRRLQVPSERALRWCRAAQRAIENRQPMPPAAALTLSQAQHGGAPLAIFLGITLDGIPESLVIGSSMIHASISLSLIVGLFLSNFPEALSSSVGMRQQGMGFGRILGMWSALMLITGVGAAAGSLLFQGASPNLFGFVEGLAAGAMLTMIAETMLPEAYLKGGNVVGLSTLAGFLIAIFSKTLEAPAPHQAAHITHPLPEAVQGLGDRPTPGDRPE